MCVTPTSAQITWEKANAREQFISMRNGRSGEMYGVNDRLFQSLDEGRSWIVFNNQGGEQCVAVDSTGDLFVATSSALFVSIDTGNSWVDLKFRGCTAVEIHDGAVYTASDSGLYRSTDKGLNWTHLYSTTLTISKIAFASSGQIFIVQRGTLTRFQSDGTGAKVIFPTSYVISSIYTAPPSKVFLTIAKDVGGDLEVSSDNGDTPFLEIGYGNTVMNGVVVGDSEKLYAVGGVQDASSSMITKGFALEAPETFASTTNISEGLPQTDVRVLTISPHGRLVVSTDSGIYRTAEAVREVAVKRNEGISASIFPNPSSGDAILSFSMRQAGEVSYRLYDQLGRLVKAGENRAETQGLHQLLLSHLPLIAGQYFCVLNLGGQTSTFGFIRSR